MRVTRKTLEAQNTQLRAQLAKTMKLSEAIRIGKPLVGTEHCDFKLCAIGCAWAGMTGARMTDEDLCRIHGKYPKEFCGHAGVAILKELGFPEHLGSRVSQMHTHGMPALEIADWLESKGL